MNLLEDLRLTDNNNGGCCFLYYHRIGDMYKGVRNISVSTHNFIAHIRYLREHFLIRKFDDDSDYCRERTIIVGFDDGYRDVYEIVFPIIEKYKVPIAIFMVSGGIGGSELWNDRLERIWLKRGKDVINEYYQLHRLVRSHFQPSKLEEFLYLQEHLLGICIDDKDQNRLLNEKELRELSDSPLVTIGGHTFSHSDLSFLSREDQFREIAEDKKVLESVIGKEITSFSYPFGGVGDDTAYILKKVGYKRARCSTKGIANNKTDRYLIPGYSVRDISIDEFKIFINSIWQNY